MPANVTASKDPDALYLCRRNLRRASKSIGPTLQHQSGTIASGHPIATKPATDCRDDAWNLTPLHESSRFTPPSHARWSLRRTFSSIPAISGPCNVVGVWCPRRVLRLGDHASGREIHGFSSGKRPRSPSPESGTAHGHRPATCAFLTTRANSAVAFAHERMPVILRDRRGNALARNRRVTEERWLLSSSRTPRTCSSPTESTRR